MFIHTYEFKQELLFNCS